MAAGSGLGGLLSGLMPLAILAGILYNRHEKKSGKTPPVDEDFEKRQAATRESERRMRAYLAQRSSAEYVAKMGDDEEEQKP